MQVSQTGSIQVSVGQSVLKSAIKQPELAAELISKSLPLPAASQAQQPARTVDMPDGDEKGGRIDIRI